MIHVTKKNGNSINGINFIIYPIMFCLLGFGLIYFALSPIVKPLLSAMELIMLSSPPTFDKSGVQAFVKPEEPQPIVVPSSGDVYGNIKIDTAKIDAQLYYGDSKKELKNGIGTYTSSYIPGQGRTILLSGHNNSFFHTLGQAKIGDKINITTNYGDYVYEITGTKIALNTDTTAYDLNKKEENLILYTCYPFVQYGLTPQRYFVYAKYLSGPQRIRE